jgi:type I restriction enzyme, S subunit
MSYCNAIWQKKPIERVYLDLFDGPHATPKPSETGPVFLGIKNITEDGHLDLSDVRHIAEEDFSAWTRRVLPRAGDIVFTYEATLNRYAIIPEGFRGCLGRRLALIRPNPKKIDTRYLYYYFFSPEWRDTVASNMILGSTVDRIPLNRFPKFEISAPPLPIQSRIAAVLSAYDDLIENNRRRIAILEEMARSLYREWFVEFRFPGHENVPIVEQGGVRAPEGWEVVNATNAIYINPSTRVPRDGLKPFVSMGGLSENSMLVSEVEYREGNSGSKFKNGDTLFARITPCLENGKTGFVQFLPSPDAVAFGSTEFIVLRSRTLCPEMVYLLARSNEFRDNAIKSMSGATGRQRVQEKCFEQFYLAQPDHWTLMLFAEQVAPMFRAIYILAEKNKNLHRTRNLLLPRLVSGELNVSELEIAGVEAAESEVRQ